MGFREGKGVAQVRKGRREGGVLGRGVAQVKKGRREGGV